MFVSVNQSFQPQFSLSQLEQWVERAWPMSVGKAGQCDRVVAVYEGAPVAAWRIRFVFPTDQTYKTSGGPRQRIGLSLGDPLPVLAEYDIDPTLRRGVTTVLLTDVERLSPERPALLPGTEDDGMDPEADD
jgi:hypothetical protein